MTNKTETSLSTKLWQLQIFLEAAGLHEQSDLAFAAIQQLAAAPFAEDVRAVVDEPVAWIKPDVVETLRKDECCYAFGSNSPKGNLIPLYRHPQRQAVPQCSEVSPQCSEHLRTQCKLEMADVVKAHMDIPGCPVLTSNQCHALALKLNETLNK